MGIKSILCVFNGTKDELSAVNAALELAKIVGAHVRFLHISNDDISNYIGIYQDGFVISPELIDFIERENKARLEKAKHYIISLTTKHNITLDTNELIGHHASAQFINKTGYPEEIIGREGLASDIIVLGCNTKNHDAVYNDNMIAAIFNTGRPVLFLPSTHNSPSWNDEVVSIAWDGSIESARAIYNVMPILKRAKRLYLLTACDNDMGENIISQSSMMEYLLIHGLKPNYIMLNCSNHSSAETILTKAKELQSNLLVMGAYGHSRFREIILGGFTKHMLEKSDIPLLLSH